MFPIPQAIRWTSLLLALGSLPSQSADLWIDPGFRPDFENAGSVQTLQVQSTGRILIAGDFKTVAGSPATNLARILPEGQLDPSFSLGNLQPSSTSIPTLDAQDRILLFTGTKVLRLAPDGAADTNFPALELRGNGAAGGALVNKIIVQPDQKILLAGRFTNLNGQATGPIVRLFSDGSLDPEFVPPTITKTGRKDLAVVNDAAVGADGSIAIVGNFESVNNRTMNRLALLNADGSLRSGFNSPLGSDSVRLVARQSGGQIIVAGDIYRTGVPGTPIRLCRISAAGVFDNGFLTNTAPAPPVVPSSLLVDAQDRIWAGGAMYVINGAVQDSLVRLQPDGKKDLSFNSGLDAEASVKTLAFLSGGRLLVGGQYQGVKSIPPISMARLESDGRLDPSFTCDLVAKQPSVDDVAVQSDGRIWVAGQFTKINGTPRHRLARLLPDGALDLSFDPGAGISNPVQDIELERDGDLLVMGDLFFYNGRYVQGLIRVRSDGTQDTGFKATLFSGAKGQVAITPDDKIVVGGWFSSINGSNQKILARLHRDGTLDANFTPVIDSSWVHSLAALPDGRIVIGGSFQGVNGTPRNRIARLLANGQLDPAFDPPGGADGDVDAITPLANGALLLAGRFSAYSDINPSGVVRILPDGLPDRTFSFVWTGPWGFPTPWVNQIKELPDGKILAAGSFSQAAAGTRNLVRLLPDGTVDSAFESINPDGPVSDLAIEPDGSALVAGAFNNVAGQATSGLARVLSKPWSEAYYQWRQQNRVPSGRGDAADDDGDSIPLLAEYALRLDPKKESALTEAVTVRLEASTVTWTWPGLPAEIAVTVHASEDLFSWSSADAALERTPSSTKVTLPMAGQMRFLRLQFSRN